MSTQNIVNINESNLQQTLEQSMTTPVLFYFWSERSQHCLQLTPVLESLAAQYNGQFILAKLDCDAEQMIASQFGLRAIPTVYLFQNGQPVDGFQGPQPEEVIRALLEKVLPSEEELKARQAIEFIEAGNHADALPLLKEAWQISNQSSEIGLLLAETQIALNRSDEAEAVLKTISVAGSGHPLSGTGGADRTAEAGGGYAGNPAAAAAGRQQSTGCGAGNSTGHPVTSGRT